MSENYQKVVEETMMRIDIEEAALNAAKSEYDADDAETRLRKYREEAERLLIQWGEERNTLYNLFSDAWHERVKLAQMLPESKQAYDFALAYEENLNKTHLDLSIAIEALDKYLRPDERQAETPQELAEYALEEILRIEGDTMREGFFASLRDYGQTREWSVRHGLDNKTVFELLEDAIVRMQEEEELPLFDCGIEELVNQYHQYGKHDKRFDTTFQAVQDYFLGSL
jgi:hypothetical protein